MTMSEFETFDVAFASPHPDLFSHLSGFRLAQKDSKESLVGRRSLRILVTLHCDFALK
jgi:hypothetical protein